MPATAPKRSDAGDAPVEVLEEIFLELKDTHGSMDILTDLFDLIEEEDEERLLTLTTH